MEECTKKYTFLQNSILPVQEFKIFWKKFALYTIVLRHKSKKPLILQNRIPFAILVPHDITLTKKKESIRNPKQEQTKRPRACYPSITDWRNTKNISYLSCDNLNIIDWWHWPLSVFFTKMLNFQILVLEKKLYLNFSSPSS